MFWMSIVLVVSFAGHAYTLYNRCASTTFQFNGQCIPCLENCISCDSNTSCSTCKSNYYGPTCQNECEQECAGICHKEYGYCTFGCPDGAFIVPEYGLCMRCPANCLLCSSAMLCIACAKGFYGLTCRSRCHEACLDNKCNNTNGACFGCKEGYFNTDDGCRRCFEGCARCNDAGNCSECQPVFFGPFDGRCIFECSKNDINRRCLARSDDKCGSSIQRVIGDPEMCPNIWGDRSYECLTERYCMILTTCTADHRCSSGRGDVPDGVCARVMSEECRTVCAAPTSRAEGFSWKHQCNQKCRIDEPNDIIHGPLCFQGNKPVAVNVSDTFDSLHETKVRCYQGSDTTVTTDGGTRTYLGALITVGSIGLVATCIAAILLISRWISRKSNTRTMDHSTQTNDEPVTTDLEVGGIRMIHPTLQRHAPIITGKGEGIPQPRNQPATPHEEYTDETVRIPLRILATVQHEERANTAASAGMTSLMNKHSVSREEYTTLGVDVEVHNYESLGNRDSYEDCELIKPTSDSDVNSREATGTPRDYLTPTM